MKITHLGMMLCVVGATSLTGCLHNTDKQHDPNRVATGKVVKHVKKRTQGPGQAVVPSVELTGNPKATQLTQWKVARQYGRNAKIVIHPEAAPDALKAAKEQNTCYVLDGKMVCDLGKGMVGHIKKTRRAQNEAGEIVVEAVEVVEGEA